MRAILAIAALAGFVTCNNNNASSCDQNSASGHACVDLTISGSVPGAYWDEVRAQCTQRGGTVVLSCARAGAVGGCRNTVTANGFTETVVTWYYAGDAAQLMAACAQNKGAWENP